MDKIIFGNIRGLFPSNNQEKIKIIEDMSIYHNAYIISLTESHLKERIENNEININNFQVVRSNTKRESVVVL